MKLTNILVLAAVVLAQSCTISDSKIQATTIQPSGTWTKSPTDAMLNVQVMDTLYTVSPSTSEKLSAEKSAGDLYLALIGIALLSGAIVFYVVKTSKGADNPGLVIVLILGICGGGAIFGSAVEWNGSNSAQMIKKPIYDSLIHADGNLHAFWNSLGY